MKFLYSSDFEVSGIQLTASNKPYVKVSPSQSLIDHYRGLSDSEFPARNVFVNDETDFVDEGVFYRKCVSGGECDHPSGPVLPINEFVSSTIRGDSLSFVIGRICTYCSRRRRSLSRPNGGRSAYSDLNTAHHKMLLGEHYGERVNRIPDTFNSRYSQLLIRHDNDETVRLTSPLLLIALWHAQDKTCPVSGWSMPIKYMWLDHITSVAKGGGGNISNLVFLHKAINKAKGGLPLDQFCKRNGFDYDEVYSRIQAAHDRLQSQGFIFD